jgi:hypothetical protein
MTDGVFKTGIAQLTKLMEAGLSTHLKTQAPAVPVPILAHYLATELFGLLKWWLDHEMPYPPERMEDIFHALVTPTFKAAVHT